MLGRAHALAFPGQFNHANPGPGAVDSSHQGQPQHGLRSMVSSPVRPLSFLPSPGRRTGGPGGRVVVHDPVPGLAGWQQSSTRCPAPDLGRFPGLPGAVFGQGRGRGHGEIRGRRVHRSSHEALLQSGQGLALARCSRGVQGKATRSSGSPALPDLDAQGQPGVVDPAHGLVPCKGSSPGIGSPGRRDESPEPFGSFPGAPEKPEARA